MTSAVTGRRSNQLSYGAVIASSNNRVKILLGKHGSRKLCRCPRVAKLDDMCESDEKQGCNEPDHELDMNHRKGIELDESCATDVVGGKSSLSHCEKVTQDGMRHRAVLSFVRRNGHLDDRLKRAWSRYASDFLLDANAETTASGPVSKVAVAGAGSDMMSVAAGLSGEMETTVEMGEEETGEGARGAGRSLNVRSGFALDQNYVRRVWGNCNPLIVEIGTGQGENVVAAAQARPECNFLAVEVYDPGVAHTMLLAGKAGLTNLRIAQVNAPELIDCFEAGVVNEFWTFFPDPWPKMRHHKRRIVQPALAQSVHRALKTGGLWRLATDIEDYALHVHEVMDVRSDFENMGDITASLPTGHVGKGTSSKAADLPHSRFVESQRFEGRVLTNFERKGLKADRVIHDFTYRAR